MASILRTDDIQNSLGNGKPTVNSETIITSEATQTISGQKTFITPIKVADAINNDEALSKGQLLTEIKAVDGVGSGLDADTVDGKQSDITAVPNTIPIRDADAALSGKNQCTAWALVHDDGTNIIIRDSYNISSITKTSTGKGVITFIDVMATTNYSIIGANDGDNTASALVCYDSLTQVKNLTSIGYRNVGFNGTAYNLKEALILVFGGK